MPREGTSDRARDQGALPELSVIVPTFGRPERVGALLERLGRQTLAPRRFEAIVVDDGSPEPVRAAGGRPYDLVLLRQENAGPGAARNLALSRARAPLALILNDDAVPADDLLERHLAVHAENERGARAKLAVLGTFRFAPAAVAASPFVDLLDRTDLLFDFSRLAHGGLHGWPFFWTCNVSLPVAAIAKAGGFDAARFRDIVEDVELGYRLERLGWRVLHRADLVAHHDHVWGRKAYFERAFRLGRNLARMHAKHGDPTVLRLGSGTTLDARALRPMQATCEALWPQLAKVEALLARIEDEHRGRPLPDALVRQLEALVARVAAVPFHRGVLFELCGCDPGEALAGGAPKGVLTSVIVVSHDALERTRRCVEALRAAADPDHPTELLVVDNGSTDGSREWLAAQPDVVLVANRENEGAPRARNQALELARGELVAFLDNDAYVAPGWLARLAWHLAVDPLAACVGPLSDRAAHGQEVAYAGGSSPEDVAACDRARAAAHARQARRASLLSSFCLLARTATIRAIGGFDERFSPWGFEDDDLTLRAALATGHNRVALDVFVRHESYRGPKLERHERLLELNWARFRDKWGLPRGAARGDYSGLGPLFDLAGPSGSGAGAVGAAPGGEAAGDPAAGTAAEPAGRQRCAT